MSIPISPAATRQLAAAGANAASSRPWLRAFVATSIRHIGAWIERSRQRRALAELAHFNRHLLDDIGLTDEEAHREAAKWFWQSSTGL